MRTTLNTGVLEPLSATNLALADATEDIRGVKVYDRDGQEFGKVDDVFIDTADRRARFVSVKSGDILGLGGQTHLLPIEAIAFDGERIMVNETVDRIMQGPQWDGRDLTPTDVGDATTTSGGVPVLEEVYRHYNVQEPFWSTNYRQPVWNR